MPLNVKLTENAQRFLESRDRKTKEAIKKHLALLAGQPTAYPLSKPLRGRLERCCRVGDYRILFLISEKKNDETEDTLLVVTIGHRKDVYE